jgi:hypothetical protein
MQHRLLFEIMTIYLMSPSQFCMPFVRNSIRQKLTMKLLIMTMTTINIIKIMEVVQLILWKLHSINTTHASWFTFSSFITPHISNHHFVPKICFHTFNFSLRIPYSYTSFTERPSSVVSSPASYSGGAGFKSRPGDRLSWLRFVVVFSVPPGKCRDSTFN